MCSYFSQFGYGMVYDGSCSRVVAVVCFFGGVDVEVSPVECIGDVPVLLAFLVWFLGFVSLVLFHDVFFVHVEISMKSRCVHLPFRRGRFRYVLAIPRLIVIHCISTDRSQLRLGIAGCKLLCRSE